MLIAGFTANALEPIFSTPFPIVISVRSLYANAPLSTVFTLSGILIFVSAHSEKALFPICVMPSSRTTLSSFSQPLNKLSGISPIFAGIGAISVRLLQAPNARSPSISRDFGKFSICVRSLFSLKALSPISLTLSGNCRTGQLLYSNADVPMDSSPLPSVRPLLREQL